MNVKTKIDYLRKLNKDFLMGGGLAAIEKQHSLSKMTARERLHLLFDNGFYEEIFKFVEHTSKNRWMLDKQVPSEGVVVALGPVEGRLAFASAQDFTVMGGSVGENHAEKIVEIMQMALKEGAPYIAINDSGGARIQEGVQALRGYGHIFYHNTLLSGVVPQIAIIAGPCAGGAAYSPALMDFIIMVDKIGKLFIAGSQVIREATGEIISDEELGGAYSQATYSGNIHFIAKDDYEAVELCKKLLSYLPQNNTELPPYTGNGELLLNEDEALNYILPDDHRESYDMHDIINRVIDEDSMLEVQPHFAKNIIVAFARINGNVVGIVANQPKEKFGALDIDASDKSSRFIRFCNAFNIPIVSFVDVPGFLPGVDQELGGIIRHGAKMLFAYSAATVPKITIIIRKAYGGAYLAMSAKSLGADRTAAWPTAEVAVMGGEGAVSVLFKNELKQSENPEQTRAELIKQYRDEFASPFPAAKAGMIDSVIEPKYTRRYISLALDSLKNKREIRPQKKHGLIPL